MKLYCMPGACSLGDHIALEWIGADYEVEVLSHDALKGDYLKVNPSGAVPALKLDDGTILTQNIAILDYLSRLKPEASLEGDGSPVSRAKVLRWLGFLNSDVHKNFSPLFGAARYVSGEAAQADLKAKAIERIKRQLAILDTQMGEGHWLVDNRRSIADPYLYVLLRWAHALKIDVSPYANLDRFFRHMEADAGVQKALKAEGLV